MRYPEPLIEGTWVRRHKRFMLDVRLKGTDEVVVAHCPNTGSMKGVNQPGARCLLLPSDNPKRRLRFTLEAVRERQESIEEFVKDSNWTLALRTLLKGLKDLERTTSRLNYGVANARDLINLKIFLSVGELRPY